MMSIRTLVKPRFSSNYVNPLHRVRTSPLIDGLGDEHSRSFPLAVSADGFNLYLVDETGNSMRLFTAENDE